jgi:hypothetical protein
MHYIANSLLSWLTPHLFGRDEVRSNPVRPSTSHACDRRKQPSNTFLHQTITSEVSVHKRNVQKLVSIKRTIVHHGSVLKLTNFDLPSQCLWLVVVTEHITYHVESLRTGCLTVLRTNVSVVHMKLRTHAYIPRRKSLSVLQASYDVPFELLLTTPKSYLEESLSYVVCKGCRATASQEEMCQQDMSYIHMSIRLLGVETRDQHLPVCLEDRP